MRLSAAILLLVLLSACNPSPEPPAPTARRPNVVILLLDTVRADRLGSYGYARARTPVLDALARESLRYSDCSSVSCWTLPSHASLFTGVLPVAHRATQETLELDGQFPTLAGLLAAQGYATYGASDNAVVGPENGLDRGFAHFEELYRDAVRNQHRDSERHPHAVALDKWLRARDPERPYFAFLNFIEAHAPYRPPQAILEQVVPEGMTAGDARRAGRVGTKQHYLQEGGLGAETLAQLSVLYDGEIAYLDTIVAQVLELLRAHGDLQNTLLIVTADHGEAFGEHGNLAHKFSLHQEVIHVPLLLRFPDGRRAGETDTQPVSLMDLFPTVLDATGCPPPARIDGQSLLGVRAATEPIYAEYYYPAQVLSNYSDEEIAANAARFVPLMQRLRAARVGVQKLIVGSDGGSEFYLLDRDPLELSPLAPDARLRALLEGFEARYAGPVPIGPTPPKGWKGRGFDDKTQDPELLEQLRALGYVD